MVKQLSVFAENAKGAMHSITRTLADAGINITGLVTNDSAEYGIVRMIVSDPEAARQALSEAGYQCRLTSVICAYIADDPGSLCGLLADIDDCNVNIDYLYVSFDRGNGVPIAILHAESPAELESTLAYRGYRLL